MNYKIKDLPLYVKETVFLRQIEQGNLPDEDVMLSCARFSNNFDWDETEEKFYVWGRICDEDDFEPFCLRHNITKGELNEHNPAYLNSTKSKTDNKLLNYNQY